MSEKIEYINQENYYSKVNSAALAVVDFYSTECPPCEALADKFEGLSRLYGDDIRFYKIFRQENRELSEKLGIKSSPTLLFYENGKLTGEILTGAIKRRDILINLDKLLDEEKISRIKSAVKPVTTECDVAIIGGGPAGLSAAIYSAQAKLKTILIDQALFGGQVNVTHQVSNYPGFIEPVKGFMLGHYISEQARAAGVIFRAAADITDVDISLKQITLDEIETIKARKIIMATGSSPRKLNIPGETEYKGKGISYCATCDAKYYQDKHVIVIGGGNSALEESLFIGKFASEITIVHQFDAFTGNKTAQERVLNNPKITPLFEHEPREFIQNSDGTMTVYIENLKTGELKQISADGIFVFVGMEPNTGLVENSFKKDNWGFIITDENMATNVKDVYAAGDIRSKPYRQITTAMADGTIAAMALSKDFK